MKRLLAATVAVCGLVAINQPATAQETVKVGVLVSYSGMTSHGRPADRCGHQAVPEKIR